MIERGALWARTGIDDWQILGPMMPGSNPVKMLADVLVREAWDDPARSPLTIHGPQQRFQDTQEGFANLLRERRSGDGAFLLVIDQFEELFHPRRRRPAQGLRCAAGQGPCRIRNVRFL